MEINISKAKEVLRGIAQHTPLVHADKLSENVWIKAENLQGTGAFKLRGAYYKLSTLSNEERKKGVIAASAGNHAQGVAYACKEMEIHGVIVMPKTAPLSKIEATRSYGVEVVLQGDTFHDAYTYAKHLQQITQAVFIEPFDDEHIIAGQGTIGLEILEDMPDVDIVVVPIGGGGLISGIAYAIKQLRPQCKIIGVQTEAIPSMKASIETHHIVEVPASSTIADGIAVSQPGTFTYALCQQYVDEIITVSEEEIAAAILFLLEKMKMVSEGAGAVSIAAMMFHKFNIENKKCVCVLSGGNIDVNVLSKIIDLGLVKTGRKVSMYLHVIDKPGYLARVIQLIAKTGANIISVHHNRLQDEILANRCRVDFVLETTNEQHIQEVFDILRKDGYEPYRVMKKSV